MGGQSLKEFQLRKAWRGLSVASVTPTVIVGFVLAVGFALPTQGVAQVPTRGQPGVVDRPTARPPGPPGDIERERRQIEKLAPKPEDVPDADRVVATLRQINFKGNKVIGTATLESIAQPYLNRPVTRGEIARLKFDINRRYYDRGYILVRVVTPPQDVSAGVLNIEIYEARVGAITVQNDNVIKDHVVKAFKSQVPSGTFFNERSIEGMVNDFNDLTNVDATLNLRPGQKFGTTDMLLTLIPQEEDEQRVTVDNQGAEVTGQYVGSINLEKSNYLKLGEKFDLDVLVTDEGTWSGLGSMRVPIGFRNVMFDARVVRSHVELGDNLASLDADGDTSIWDVALSSRLVNMRRQIIQLRAGFQWRQHESFLAGSLDTRDNIRQVFAEGSYLARYPNLLVFSSLRVARGVDVLAADQQGESDNTRLNGVPEVTLIQPLLFANYRPVPEGELRLTVTGQFATNTTLASDLFTLGGYGSVRGFEPAETTGESGVQFSMEYNHTVWKKELKGSGWEAAVGPIFDGGRVWNREEAAVQDSLLMAAGIGAQVETDASKVGKTTLRADLAVPLGSYDSSEVSDVTVYFRLSQTF